MKKRSGTTVISLGGSLVVPPHDIDVDFVSRFVACINEYASVETPFVIVVGGGATARTYQHALRDAGRGDDTDVDWMGIYATYVNAQFVRLVFGEKAHTKIVTQPEDVRGVSAPIIIGGGSHPGQSTDRGAVQLAHAMGAHEVINLSNVAHVYSSDPRTDDYAQRFSSLSWDEYLSLIPHQWKPGLHTPFDPIASKEAADHNMRVVIAGNDLENLRHYFATGTIEGTCIS